VLLEKDGEDQLVLSCEKLSIRVKWETDILRKIKRRKNEWFVQILLKNWLLQHVLEGNVEMKRRGGKSVEQITDDRKEKRRYW
jgi:hypothetical protein